MFKTYLPSRFYTICFGLSLILSWNLGINFFLFFLLIIGVVGFLFRKNGPIVLREKSFKGSINSPINGLITKIEYDVAHCVLGKNLIKIDLMIPFFAEMGLYLPYTCEVTDVKGIEPESSRLLSKNEEENSLLNRSANTEGNDLYGIVVVLRELGGTQVAMNLTHHNVGLIPKVWVSAGDKGDVGANFGVMPLGGVLSLYLPKETHVLIKENDLVTAGKTILGELNINIHP